MEQIQVQGSDSEDNKSLIKKGLIQFAFINWIWSVRAYMDNDDCKQFDSLWFEWDRIG